MNPVLSFLVDNLPQRLWRPGNLHLRGRLHFCFAGTADPVRTIEWGGKAVAAGNRPRTVEFTTH